MSISSAIDTSPPGEKAPIEKKIEWFEKWTSARPRFTYQYGASRDLGHDHEQCHLQLEEYKKKLNEMSSNFQSAVTASETELSSLRTSLEEMRKDLRYWIFRCDDLEWELRRVNAEYAAECDKWASLERGEALRWKQAADSLQERLAGLEESNRRLSEQVRCAQDERDTLLRMLEIERQQGAARMRGIEEALSAARLEAESACEAALALKECAEAAQRERHDAVDRELLALRAELHALQEGARAVQRDLDVGQWREAAAQAQMEASQWRESAAQAQQAADQAQLEARRFQEIAAQAQREANQWRETATKSRQEVDKWREAAAQSEREADEWRVAAEKAQHEVDRWRDAATQAKREVEEARADAAQWHEQAADSETCAACWRQEAEQWRETALAAEHAAAQCRAEVHDILREAQECRQLLECAQQEALDWQERVELAEAEALLLARNAQQEAAEWRERTQMREQEVKRLQMLATQRAESTDAAGKGLDGWRLRAQRAGQETAGWRKIAERAQRNLVQVRREIAEWHAKADAARAEATECRRRLDAAMQELESCRAEAQSAQHMAQEIQQLSEELANLRSNICASQQERTLAREVAAHWRVTAHATLPEIDELRQQLRREGQQCAEVAQEAALWQQRASEEAFRRQAAQEAEQATRDSQQCRFSAAFLSQQLERAQAELQKLREEHAALQASAASLEKRATDARASLREAQHALETVRAESQAWREEAQQRSVFADTALRAADIAREEARHWARHAAAARHELEELQLRAELDQQALTAAWRECFDLRCSLSDAIAEYKWWQAAASDLATEVAHLFQELPAWRLADGLAQQQSQLVRLASGLDQVAAESCPAPLLDAQQLLAQRDHARSMLARVRSQLREEISIRLALEQQLETLKQQLQPQMPSGKEKRASDESTSLELSRRRVDAVATPQKLQRSRNSSSAGLQSPSLARSRPEKPAESRETSQPVSRDSYPKTPEKNDKSQQTQATASAVKAVERDDKPQPVAAAHAEAEEKKAEEPVSSPSTPTRFKLIQRSASFKTLGPVPRSAASARAGENLTTNLHSSAPCPAVAQIKESARRTMKRMSGLHIATAASTPRK